MGGHLKVTKIYDDHKEVILDDSNMLTQGFNVNIVSVLTGEILEVPTLIPGYFQLGASGMNPTVNGASVKATATITFAGAASNGDTITIIDTAGTSKTYTVAADGDPSDGEFPGDPAGGMNGLANGLTLCIEHANGHNGTITVATGGTGAIILTQSVAGSAGNTTITKSGLGVATVVQWSGGVGPLSDDIFYHLSAPLSTTTQYGNETPLELEKLNRSFLASTADSSASIIDGTAVYSEMLWVSSPEASTTPSATLHTSGGEWFVPILGTHLTKNYIDSIEVTLELDKNTANDILIREFGLFSKNAVAYKNNKPFLIAYKQLSAPITKKSEFSLLIEWSLGFLGKTNIYDNITPGFK